MTANSGISRSTRLLLTPPQYQTGWQETVLVPTPAPGQVFSHVVPGQYHERLYAVAYRLVTSAVVATRFCAMVLRDNNGNRVLAGKSSGAVPAGTSLFPNLCVTVPVDASGTTGSTYGYLPDVLVPPGWAWNLEISGIDVADQVDQIVLLVQRFPSDITRLDYEG